MMTLSDLAERTATKLKFNEPTYQRNVKDDCDNEEFNEILAGYFYDMQDQVEGLASTDECDVIAGECYSFISTTDKRVKLECAEKLVQIILSGVWNYAQDQINNEYNDEIANICQQENETDEKYSYRNPEDYV